jgi:hypothetical protein
MRFGAFRRIKMLGFVSSHGHVSLVGTGMTARFDFHQSLQP